MKKIKINMNILWLISGGGAKLIAHSILVYTEQQKKRPVNIFLFYLKLKYMKYMNTAMCCFGIIINVLFWYHYLKFIYVLFWHHCLNFCHSTCLQDYIKRVYL